MCIRDRGYALPDTIRVTPAVTAKTHPGALVIAPPSVLGSAWTKRFAPDEEAMASGWMAVRGIRRRRGLPQGLAPSDHADWAGPNAAIRATGAPRVLAPDGSEFLVHTDIDRWEAYLLEIAPEDEKAIRRMIHDMRGTLSLEQFEDAPGMRSIADYIKALYHSGGALYTLDNHMHKSCRAYFDELGFTSPRLKLYFDNLYGDLHFSAGAFLMMLTWMSKKNAGYPIGGSLPFAMRLTKRYKDLGGELLLKQRVKTIRVENGKAVGCLLYTSDAADERSSVDLGGRRIIKKKNIVKCS